MNNITAFIMDNIAILIGGLAFLICSLFVGFFVYTKFKGRKCNNCRKFIWKYKLLKSYAGIKYECPYCKNTWFEIAIPRSTGDLSGGGVGGDGMGGVDYFGGDGGD